MSMGLPPSDSTGRPITYRLAYAGRPLDDSETFNNAGIKPGEAVRVIREIISDDSLPIEEIIRSFHEKVLHLTLGFDEMKRLVATSVAQQQETRSKSVFLVHGHDSETKDEVAEFVTELGLNPIILHEEPTLGQTIIEKFERHAQVRYAIIILTADDVCAEKGSPDKLRPRARQNVLFEFGYFIGALGRDRVCALVKEGVEVPSDYSGVLYIPFGRHEKWKPSLKNELMSSGFCVSHIGSLESD